MNFKGFMRLKVIARLVQMFFAKSLFAPLLIFVFTASALISIPAFAANQNHMVYSGRIVKPDGTPLEAASVQFNIGVYSPNNCLLWSEVQTVNMTGKLGTFTIKIGDSTATGYSRTDGGPLASFEKVFDNSSSVAGLSGTGCPGTYSPGATDDRILMVSFNDGTGSQTLAAQNIKAVPFAANTAALQGIPLGNTTPTSGQVLKFDGTQWVAGTDLTGAAALTGIYPVTVTSGTISLTNGASNQILGMNNAGNGYEQKSIVAGSGVTITHSAGSIAISATGGSGTVTNVGLTAPAIFSVTGSPVTGAGTIDMALATQTQNYVFAAPKAANGAPSFRKLEIVDLYSSLGGAFLTGGSCTAGQALAYSSVTDTISCQNLVPLVSNNGSLSNGRVWIGDATGKAQEQSITGDASLSVAGTLTVTGLQGRSVASSAPTDGHVLTWNNTTSTWESRAATGGNSSGTAGHIQFSNGSGGFSSDTNQLFWDSTNDRLGIGTNAPARGLTVSGGGLYSSGTGGTTGVYAESATGYALFATSNTGVSGLFAPSNAGNTNPSLIAAHNNTSANIFEIQRASDNFVYSAFAGLGQLGLGTSAPSSMLDVNGAFTIRGTTVAAAGTSSAGQGRIYFDSTANKFKVSENGGTYVDLVGSWGSSTPAGTNGMVQFNSGGTLGASGNYVWSNTTQTLTVTGLAADNSVRIPTIATSNNKASVSIGSALATNNDGTAIGFNVPAGFLGDFLYMERDGNFKFGIDYDGNQWTTGNVNFVSNPSPVIANTTTSAGANLNILGGAAVDSYLSLTSTSAAGTSDSIRFKVGNNGATEAMRINTNGSIMIGTTTPVGKLTAVANGGANDLASKFIFNSNSSNWGQVQLGNSSHKEVSLAYIGNVTAFAGDPGPTSSSGDSFVWNTGIGLYDSLGSQYGVANKTYGGPMFIIDSAGGVAVGTYANQSHITAPPPNGMIISGSLGLGLTSPASRADINGALNIRGTTVAAAGTSGTGQGRIYFDSTANKFKVSENGAAYVDLVGSGSGTVSGTTGKIAKFTSGTAVGDSLITETAGTISVAGSLGIGTATPNYPLHVQSTGSGSTSIHALGNIITESNFEFRNLANGKIINRSGLGSGITLAGGETDSSYLILASNSDVGSATSNDYISMRVNNGNTEAIRIVSSGRVGIGTSTPDSRLDIGQGAFTVRGTTVAAAGTSSTSQGRIYFDSTANKFKVSENGGAYVDLVGSGGSSTPAGTNGMVQFNSAGTLGASANLTWDAANQRLGIGTASPSAQFEIGYATSFFKVNQGATLTHFSDDGMNATAPLFSLTNADTTNGQSQGLHITAGNGNLDYPLRVQNRATTTDILAARGDGNVGIGTSSPSAKLEVRADSATGNSIIEGLRLAREDSDSAAANGVGVSLTFNLETTTDGTMREAAKIAGVFDDANNNSKDGSLRFYTMGPNAASGTTTTSERMRIDSEGRVAVGTTSTNPYYIMVVEGSGASTGGLYAGSATLPSAFFQSSSGGNPSPTVLIRADSFPISDLLVFQDNSGNELSSINQYGHLTLNHGNTADSVLDIAGAFTVRGTTVAAAGTSSAGQGRIYFDSTANKFKVSENGGAYVDLVGSGGATSIDGLSDAIADAGNNLFLGGNAGNSSTGGQNIGIGAYALTSTGAGVYNTAIGFNALMFNNTGNWNVALGALALRQHTAGSSNVALGSYSLYSLTSGSANTAVGDMALEYLSSGSDNVAIGTGAGNYDYSHSLTADRNVFIGVSAAGTLTAGSDNVMIGYQAGDSLDSGNGNIIIGSGADVPAGTTSNFLSIGNVIHGNLSTGRIGIGTVAPDSRFDIGQGAFTVRGTTVAAAGTSSTSQGRIYFDSTANKFKVSENGGAYVDLVGGGGSASGTTGHIQFSNGSGGFSSDSNQLFWDATNNRLGIGTNAPGLASLDVVGSDSDVFRLQNTDSAGATTINFSNSSGTQTSVLGYSNASAPAGIYPDAFWIGTAAKPIIFDTGLGSTEKMRLTASGNLGIGTTNPGEKLEVNGTIKATDLVLTSDARAKSQIQSLDAKDYLQKVCSLNPVSFQWNSNNKNDLGVIAQEVRQVFPDLVIQGPDGSLAVKYTSLIAPLISSIQELNRKNQELEKQNLELALQMDELKKENQKIKSNIDLILKKISESK